MGSQEFSNSIKRQRTSLLRSAFYIILIFLFSCSDVVILKSNQVEKAATNNQDEAIKETPKSVKMVPHPVVAEEKVSKKQETQELQDDETDDDKEKSTRLSYEEKSKILKAYCDRTQKTFNKYDWGESYCESQPWKFVRTSVNGDPLLWRTFGARGEGSTEVTLIMCGVHGDEITPIKFCYDTINYLEKVSQGKVIDPHTKKKANLEDKLVIVAPLVNPDSYFKTRPTRTNANGVDVNRNFPTHDFLKSAIKSWETRYNKDKRRFPGDKPMSEPETVFQVNLIYRYKPNKIISVHAPLTMLDYDGPASAHEGGFVGSRANQLLIRMSEQAKGYRIKNYPFFPGSLGNYAGNERNIPTYTLELPTSDPAKAASYWSLFKSSIHSAVMHEIKGEGFVALDQEENPLKDSRSN